MRKKYAICGVSGRALGQFAKPIHENFSHNSEVIALLDTDPARFEAYRSRFPEHADVPVYSAADFETMVDERQPDCIIVAGRDDTHVHYITAALQRNLDVITEKPMATTGADARRILEAEAASRGKVTVTFNYRYMPIHMRIKHDLTWNLNDTHGIGIVILAGLEAMALEEWQGSI